jgi:hypothetical protein
MQPLDAIACIFAFAEQPPRQTQADDRYTFDFAGHSATLRVHPGQRSFSLRVHVGCLASARFHEIAPRLLAANLACEHQAFALDEEGMVSLFQNFWLDRLDSQTLGAALASLSARVARWREQLAPALAGASEVSA